LGGPNADARSVTQFVAVVEHVQHVESHGCAARALDRHLYGPKGGVTIDGYLTCPFLCLNEEAEIATLIPFVADLAW
jgi:hypothetical protein